MKTPTVFKADQFTFDVAKGQYVAEASTLGLKPGESLRTFQVELLSKEIGSYNKPYLVPFTFVACDYCGDEVAGWRYDSTTSLRALIIND